MSRSTLSPISSGGLSFIQSPPSLRTPTSAQSKGSSFLPIPTPRKTSLSVNSPRTVASSPSQSSLNVVYEKSKLKSINTNTSNATTSSPSLSLAKARGSSASDSRLTGLPASPQISANSTPTTYNNPIQKPTQQHSSPGVIRRPADELVTNEQTETLAPARMPHSLRRIPRLPRQNILNTNRTHHLSITSMLTAEPPIVAGRRPARSKVITSPLIHPQLNHSVNRGLTPPHQARKAKSQQELQPKLRPSQRKMFSAEFTTPVKQSSTHSESDSTSPESLQSKITLTDGNSSNRSRFEYAHKTSSTGFSRFNSMMASSNSSNVVRRAADVLVPPPNTNKLPFTLGFHVPPEAQPRLLILQKLKSFIVGNETWETLINFQMVYRLICQPDLYETTQDIERRIFENSIPFIPQATLEIPTHVTPSLKSCYATGTASTLATQSIKKLHVGAIILEKLRRVSKNGTGQSFKYSPTKSINKSVRASPPQMSQHTSKLENANSSTLLDKTSNPDQNHQRRFSQVLGAGLEFMNHSICVVTMDERLHLLPTLPFTVIEEIYRRGMRTPGILRISGDFTRIDELVKTFESCPSSGIDLSSEDIHTLCGLLKYYLRSLPQPLFHPLLSDIFWISCVRPDRNRNTSLEKGTRTSAEYMIARYLLQLIPSRSLSLLAYVIPFLAHVPTFSENRIQDESLATMLGPAIFISRNIGFPGLGLHPRITKITATQAAEDLSTPNLNQVEKNKASERAAESTLWMMNNWKILFTEVYSAGNSKTEAMGSMEDHNWSSLSLQQNRGSFQDNTQFHLPKTSTNFAEIFIHSRPSSILTYSSGLTDSRRSIIIGDSNQSSSAIQSPVGSEDLEFLTPHGIDQLDSPRDPMLTDTLSSSADEFPFPASKEVEATQVKQQTESSKTALKKDDKEHKLKHSTLTLFKHTTQEEERRERRNSEKLTKLLVDYIEGKEEKIIQRETIIESLIEEIGRLNTVDHEDEIERGKSLWEKIKLHSNPVRKSSDQPLEKINEFLNAIDEQHSNNSRDDDLEKSQCSLKVFNQVVSNQTTGFSSADHSPKLKQEFHSHHPEQISNFEITDDGRSTEHGEEADSNQAKKKNKSNVSLTRDRQPSSNRTKFETDTFDILLGKPNPKQESSVSLKDNNDLSTGRRNFDTQRSAGDNDDTEHLRSNRSFLSGETSQGESFESLQDDQQLDSLDFGDLSLESSRLSLNSQNLNYTSKDSNFVSSETEAYKAEIARLRLINSKLLHKLKSIESIIVTDTSEIIF